MVNKEEYFMIHTLYNRGYSQRELEKLTGISRKTLSKYLNMEIFPSRTEYPKRPSKLEPYMEYLKSRVEHARPHKLPATALIREIQEQGYDGGLTILRGFLRSLYPVKAEEELVRFETKPGHQMQVDFATVKNGKDKQHVFIAELGYSRKSYSEFVTNQTVETLVSCHINAFNYFGGVPKEILYDNAKSVVIERDFYGKGQHKFQDMLLDMCKHYGAQPRLCLPYRAKTKGKVERFIHYLKHSFYYPEESKLRMNGLSMDISTANRRFLLWNEEVADVRIHGTTKQRPIDMFELEKGHLQPLPSPYTGTYPAKAIIVEEKYDLRSFEISEIDVQLNPLELYDALIGAES